MGVVVAQFLLVTLFILCSFVHGYRGTNWMNGAHATFYGGPDAYGTLGTFSSLLTYNFTL